MIGVAGRKLVLVKHDQLLNPSLSKSRRLPEQVAGVLAELLEYSQFDPVQQSMFLPSEDVHKAHLLNGLLQIKWS